MQSITWFVLLVEKIERQSIVSYTKLYNHSRLTKKRRPTSFEFSPQIWQPFTLLLFTLVTSIDLLRKIPGLLGQDNIHSLQIQHNVEKEAYYTTEYQGKKRSPRNRGYHYDMDSLTHMNLLTRTLTPSLYCIVNPP